MSTPILMSWSGGKDSALALEELQRDDRYEVIGLVTTLTRGFDRISMHGVRRELLHHQARAIGLPLTEAWIPQQADNDQYEQVMSACLSDFRDQGVVTVAFGDLFLQDIREYRERLVAGINMTPVFPVWGKDTTELAGHFIDTGYKAVTCCVDTQVLPEEFCGQCYTHDFLSQLPATVDPCGENGEFHTFVFDGPIFSEPVGVQTGVRHRSHVFEFCDLTLCDSAAIPLS